MTGPSRVLKASRFPERVIFDMAYFWKPEPIKGNWACAVRTCHWEGPETSLIENEHNKISCPRCKSPDVFPSDDDWNQTDEVTCDPMNLDFDADW